MHFSSEVVKEAQNEPSHLPNSSVNRCEEIRFEGENESSRGTDRKTGNNETRINLSKGKSVVARTAGEKISGVPASTTFTIRVLLKTITVCRPSSSRGGKVSAGTTSSNGRECFTRVSLAVVKFYCRRLDSSRLIGLFPSVTFISVL